MWVGVGGRGRGCPRYLRPRPGQAFQHNTLSAFPSRMRVRDFSGLFQMKGCTRDQVKGAIHTTARRAEVSLPPPCVACLEKRINNEGRGLSVPLRHPSPVCEHPLRAAGMRSWAGQSHLLPSSFPGSSFPINPAFLGSWIKKSNEIRFFSTDFLPQTSCFQRDSSQPRK